MLNTRDEQHTLSQPTRRRANTANGKEGLKHASTLRYIQNTGQGHRTGVGVRVLRTLEQTLNVLPCFFWNLQDQKVHRYFPRY